MLSVFPCKPIPLIKQSCELMLSFAYPFRLLCSSWCPILSLNLTVASTGRQSMNQEDNMYSFTSLCASLPPVHSQSACPGLHSSVSARKRVHGGGAPTAILSRTCHPFRCFTTRSVQMTHNPIYEHWLHCWSLRTQQTTHILSYQSVEPVSQHTDTCCEQTHRSSRCRRYRQLCEILVLTISINHTSAAEHLDFFLSRN